MGSVARTMGRGFAGLAVLLAACTNAGLQPLDPDELERFDDRLTIHGEFCVQPDGEVTFPVKVLFALDQSASLQCTDNFNVRFDALNRVLDDLRSNQDVSVGFIGFASWARELGFTRDRAAWAPFLNPATSGGGTATDYQGSLATVVRNIETDIRSVSPAERARTRYVVVFISDGIPEPRCNAGCEDDLDACGDGDDNDGDGIVDRADPDCANVDDQSLAPDSAYGVCNTTEEIPDDIYVDYQGLCPAYNLPEQILRRVDELTSLGDIYSVGSITLNTVLLFSPQDVVEGNCPGATTAFGYDREQAEATLRAMATAGDGVYRDANLATGEDDFLSFDFAALETSQALTGLVAENLHHQRTRDNGHEADTDQDGLGDLEEDAAGLDLRMRDSDGDGYGDLVELRQATLGLDPRDPLVPATPCNATSDLDGDRLTTCEEVFLGLDPRDPDTDGDQMLDWFELVNGTDPLTADPFGDPDFDNVLTLDEARGGTIPTLPDEDTFRVDRIGYRIEDLGDRDVIPWGQNDPEERRCFGYSVDNIHLVTPQTAIDRGLNRILIYASEAPSQLAGARSETRVACFEAVYLGETSKNPASGVIDASEQGWTNTLLGIQFAIDRLGDLDGPDDVLDTEDDGCSWFRGTRPNRGVIENTLRQCMPDPMVLSRFAYDRAAQRVLLSQYVAGNGAVNVRNPASELFVPIETFDPERDCFRPWEIERVTEMMGQIETACQCAQPDLEDCDAFFSPCCDPLCATDAECEGEAVCQGGVCRATSCLPDTTPAP